MKKKCNQYRQGDVFLFGLEMKNTHIKKMEQISRDERNRVVLAYGESTGHAHTISDENVSLMRDKENKKIYLIVKDGALLKHEEHNPITVNPGVYRVIQQREYYPDEIRTVRD